MKVKELIGKLQKMDPDKKCIIQVDPDGNNYRPLDGVEDEAVYSPCVGCATPQGRVYSLTWGYYDNGFGSKEEWLDFKKTCKQCIVLYPST